MEKILSGFHSDVVQLQCNGIFRPFTEFTMDRQLFVLLKLPLTAADWSCHSLVSSVSLAASGSIS